MFRSLMCVGSTSCQDPDLEINSSHFFDIFDNYFIPISSISLKNR